MDMLLDLTLYVSITSIIILLIKNIFKNQLSKKMHLYIWLILFVRFFVPSLPESKVSVYNAIESDFIFVNQKVGFASQSINVEIYSYIWLIVASILLVYFIFVYISYFNKFKNYTNEYDDILEETKNIVGIKKEVKVVTGGETPMLKGVFKPTIILSNGYTKSEIKSIFLHELCHLKYNDVILNIINTIVLCLNWYNPLMWICFFVIRRDIEFACDERVLNLVSDRKNYANLLLKTALSKNKFIIGCTSMQNGEKEITKRIKFIAGFKKPKVYISIISLCLLIVVSAVCLTNGKDNTQSKVEPKIEISDVVPEKTVDNSIPSELRISPSTKQEFIIKVNDKVIKKVKSNTEYSKMAEEYNINVDSYLNKEIKVVFYDVETEKIRMPYIFVYCEDKLIGYENLMMYEISENIIKEIQNFTK